MKVKDADEHFIKILIVLRRNMTSKDADDLKEMFVRERTLSVHIKNSISGFSLLSAVHNRAFRYWTDTCTYTPPARITPFQLS